MLAIEHSALCNEIIINQCDILLAMTAMNEHVLFSLHDNINFTYNTHTHKNTYTKIH